MQIEQRAPRPMFSGLRTAPIDRQNSFLLRLCFEIGTHLRASIQAVFDAANDAGAASPG
jgi:hypothetical protein